MNTKNKLSIMILALVTFILPACISTGQRIDIAKVGVIHKNITTESDIRAMFGEPVSISMNMHRGTKVLSYGYKNDDGIKKTAVGITGGAIGGIVGHQVGGGSGQALATGLGIMFGSFLASNAVTARQERQFLEVAISLETDKVVDYNYIEKRGRSQRVGVTPGVSRL